MLTPGIIDAFVFLRLVFEHKCHGAFLQKKEKQHLNWSFCDIRKQNMLLVDKIISPIRKVAPLPTFKTNRGRTTWGKR
jgi:hypothetical protein